jgi:hypothetical protein
LGDYVVRGTGRDGSFSTIRDIKGRTNDALPVLLQQGKLDMIHPIILAEFYAAGLEKVQFISQSPGHVRIKYVARRVIDEDVRKEFQRILELKGALETSFEVHRVREIACDPETGKVRLVEREAPR